MNSHTNNHRIQHLQPMVSLPTRRRPGPGPGHGVDLPGRAPGRHLFLARSPGAVLPFRRRLDGRRAGPAGCPCRVRGAGLRVGED
jgi:hypothetical protein